MNEKIIKRIAALMSVKSLVTLIVTGVFAFLAVSGKIEAESFMSIFIMIVSFYFGTQSQKTQDLIDGDTNNS